MKKEPKFSPESREKISKYLEDVVAESQYADEGFEGIIYKLDSGNLTDEAALALKGLEVSPQKDVASKILKVYTSGQGKVEFDALSNASRILSGLKNKEGIALVPEPLFYGEIEKTKKVEAALGSKASNVSGQRAEVLLMDFVDGSNLACLFAREVLKNIQGSDYAGEDAEKMNYNALKHEISTELAQRGMPPIDEIENPLGNEMVWIGKYLRRIGYVPDAKILSQIKKTMDVLHNGGMSHGDLNPRNIIFDGNQSYVVDFGKATGRWENLSEEEKKERVNDNIFIEWLKELSERPEKKSDDRAGRYYSSIEKLIRNERFQKKIVIIESRLTEDPIGKLSQLFDNLSMTDNDIDDFCAKVLFAYEKSTSENKQEIKKFLSQKASKETGPVVDKLQMLNQGLR